ncbi:LuxR C-terminal-related transcriptional regulator [Ktedonobacter racemifer]|nr:LuxR C-terminal-related transcriptional regulator [Ktedonobacter racemifer]
MRTISMREVTFTCEVCHKSTTQQRYPGPLPRYCSPECQATRARALNETRVRKQREKRQAMREARSKVLEVIRPSHGEKSSSYPALPLLLTKLSSPRLPPLLIERAHLLSQLDRALLHAVTLLQAPAGFGKTTVVNQWINARSGHDAFPAIAWVSLDAGDNDLFRFWHYVMAACEALQRHEESESGPSTFALLTSGIQLPFASHTLEEALTLLLNMLSHQGNSGLLILDDYHVITEPRVHESLAFFLDHLPKTAHVLMLSRVEPPLPFLRWRVKGAIYELHTTDLCFSPEETAAFLSQAFSAPISDAALKQLDASLGGWAAGLRLLSLALQGRQSIHSLAQAVFPPDSYADSSLLHRSLFDYFVTEIVETQPESIQRFLLETSVLSRLNGPLCDAVIGNKNSAAQLEAIARAGLFLEALEGSGGWYRYHTLFAEALRREAGRRLSDETLSALSKRSSSWYEQQGMLSEAIEASLLARDVAQIARLVERIAAQEPVYDAKTMLRWLEPIPEAMLREYPMLCFISAIAYQALEEEHSLSEEFSSHEGRSSRSGTLLQLAEEGWRRQGNLPWLGAIQASQAISTLEQGPFSLALEYAQQALALLPQEDLDIRMRIWHSACLLLVGMEKLLEGSLSEARPLILDALVRSQVLGYSYLTHQVRLTLGRSYQLAGEYHQAQALYRQVLSEVRAQEDHELMADALLSLAWLLFEWNDLAAVEQQVQEAVEHIRFARHQKQELHERATFQLSLLQYVRGQTTEALRQLTAQLTRFHNSSASGILEFLPYVVDWQGRLLLANGNLEAVERHLEAQAHNQERLPFIHYLGTHILTSRLLLERGEVEAALIQLEHLHSNVLAQQHQYYMLEIQLLLALAHAASKENQQAQHHLRQTLTQAVNEGFIRLFLNEGKGLVPLLRSLLPTLQKDKKLRSYALIILRTITQSAGLPIAPVADSDNLLFEPLSIQEQRVLRLLAAGWTNKDIAEELIVSVNTVKDHVKHLYRKLGINNRLQAGEAARHLKLL